MLSIVWNKNWIHCIATIRNDRTWTSKENNSREKPVYYAKILPFLMVTI